VNRSKDVEKKDVGGGCQKKKDVEKIDVKEPNIGLNRLRQQNCSLHTHILL